MCVAHRCELLHLQSERVADHVERRTGADRGRADACFGLPVGDLSREHVLARRLVAAGAGHPDLVPVEDRRRATQQVEHVVAEQHALHECAAREPGRLLDDLLCAAAHVVIAEERRECGVDAICGAEVVVILQPVRESLRARHPRRVGDRDLLVWEVEHLR